MILNLRVIQAIILFSIIFISINSYEQAWAQNSTFTDELLNEPLSFFSEGDTLFEFLLFIIGIGIYSLFVWYFYRFISKRDLLPESFYPASHEKKISKIKHLGYIAIYVSAFPAIIFVWFIVLAFFVFFVSKEMPFEIAIFISMAIIAVVRILAYFREDSAKEVAKNVPYAILAFLLTSAAIYADPNFFTEKNLSLIPTQFVESFREIVNGIMVIALFEFSFRVAFIFKRRFWPVADKKLEEEIESEVEEITKAHFKKMEQKQNESEKKIDELIKKLKDVEKAHS
jgi:hypothetical protein